MASACLLALLLLLLGGFPAVPAESVGVLRDILGRGGGAGGGGGGASFVPRDPGFRMEWGTLRAAPPLSGRRSGENFVGKVSSGVSGRLEGTPTRVVRPQIAALRSCPGLCFAAGLRGET